DARGQHTVDYLPRAGRRTAGARQSLRVVLTEHAVRQTGRRDLQLSLSVRHAVVAGKRIRDFGVHADDVGADVGAVGRGVPVRTGWPEPVVAAGEVDEAGTP